jgi:hypothetical protein
MSNITINRILQALDPRVPAEAQLAAFTLYAIALLALIALFLQKDGSTRETLLLAGVILFCLIDKITATSILRDETDILGFTRGQPFGSFIIRTGMAAVPWIVAGMTKAPKSRGFLVVAGILGGIYLLMRWYYEIRPQ